MRLVAPVVGLQEIPSLVHLLAVELRLTGFVQDQVKSVVLLDLSRDLARPEHRPGRIPTIVTDGLIKMGDVRYHLLACAAHIDRGRAFLEGFLVAVH